MDHRPAWKPLNLSDLEAVSQIAGMVHPSLPERPEVFAEKVRLFPEGSRKLVWGGAILGYAIAHPWELYSIPPLDDFLGALPPRPECIFIHDIAVLAEARGKGAAQTYLEQLNSLAGTLSMGLLALVSVYGTEVLWRRFGFQVRRAPFEREASVQGSAGASPPSCEALRRKLLSYGPTAQYMVADLRSRSNPNLP